MYDDFDATRKRMGVTGDPVYRGVDFPNEVTITSDFDTPEEAMAFSASLELRQAMGNAGVPSAPVSWITSPA